ncbi:hypothetical protein MUK42_21923 [Musa troglodytarum]|uniref:Uncharacterized protein n=1 Tax=Musa troglodytarum TaxID=320322 RepID=A0A9E7K8K7_9LILI|nr:hypothetical protein MUK42_21923 [Musa troglodytarum]URE08436.1 hypothetical protein MUK42_21923 [Musa troglodytarum]
MEKDGQISVRKRPTKRRRSRGFVKAVADYLASDCYMYAPILDVPPPDLPLSSAARSPPTTEPTEASAATLRWFLRHLTKGRP